MTTRLAMTRELDGVDVEIYERIVFIGTPAIVETFYVLPAPDWPKVRIQRRRGISGLLSRFGRRSGIELDDDAFNAAYRVSCVDPEFAILLLNPELQAFIMQKRSVDWSAGGGAIKLFYGGALRRSRVDRSLERLRRFRDLIDSELFDLA